MRIALRALVPFCFLLMQCTAVAAEAIPVELRQTESGWQLFRGGEPYFIRGAGGSASLQQLAAAGANSIRTWSAEDLDQRLDAAHALGLSVTVGIWLAHERHGFDYDDATQVRAQLERARDTVMRYRGHPAVLIWGIGNEMEGFGSGDSPVIWAAVNDLAAMVKELDPLHPTMTVTAEIGGGRVDRVHHKSPAIDIHGINAYGGASSLPERLRAAGAVKPYVLTEFGPPGPWEVAKTAWSAALEPTSTEKAAFYRQSYEGAIRNGGDIALGSYAFLWGNKMEATPTWFGMFLEDGARLGVVDMMTELWSGQPPDGLAPIVEPLIIEGQTELDPGAELRVRAVVADPDGDPLRARWALLPESDDYMTGGDFRPTSPEIEGAIVRADENGAVVRMPDEPGDYRLYLYAYDNTGNAATANVPLRVKGDAQIRLPVYVYHDGFDGMPWAPSGWMGNIDSLSLDGAHADAPHDGNSCIRLRYTGKFGWAGVAWQHPPNNWGEEDGGFDLTGAKRLTLWARGEYGGEKIKIGVGLLDAGVAYPDSAIKSVDGITLTQEWQRHVIPLRRVDLSSIKTGFVVTVSGRATSVTIYLDSIRFER